MRKRFMFWLRDDKPDEHYLIDLIDYLKSRGEFASTVRDGLRLVYDLRQRKWDTLFEMFPEIETDINQRILEAKIEAYETAAGRPIQVVQQQAQGLLLDQQHPAPPPPGPQPMQIAQIAAPAFDDDDDDMPLDIRPAQDTDSGRNLVNSVMALVDS